MASKQTLSISELLVAMALKAPKKESLKEAIDTLEQLKVELPTTSIGHILEENAIRYKDRPAIFFEDVQLTHFEFNALCNQYANFFWELGIRKGTVVVVFLENRLATLMLIAALAKLGAVASLINANQRGPVLKHSIKTDHDKYFVIGESKIEAFEEIREALSLPSDIVLLGLQNKGEEGIPKEYLPLATLIQTASKNNPKATQAVNLEDRFANVFTSGTTGMPKASIQTHLKWYVCYLWYGRVCLDLNEEDVMYVTIPFFHTNAMIVAWPSAASGGAALAIRRKLSISNFWKEVKKYGVTSFIYIGEICRYLMNKPATVYDQNNPITKIVGNGLRPDIWKAFKNRFQIQEVYELYGASDGIVSFTNALNIDCTVGLCRSVYAIVKYDLEREEPYRNTDGFMERVKVGEAGLLIGEILETTHYPGYVNKEKNKEKILENVFAKGDTWFNTGDLIRDLGYCHAQFADRLGDTFRWKGENVSTAELEAIINNLPNVAHSAVYGVGLPFTDGKVGMVSIKSSIPTAQFDLVQFSQQMQEQLPSYAIPAFIRFVDNFNKTATHKIQKATLKREGIEGYTDTAIYVRLPKTTNYQPLTISIYSEIQKGAIAF